MRFNSKQFRADIITKRRIQQDLTLRQAAKKAGVSFATLSRLENGNMPKLVIYGKVCKWLESPLEKYLN